VGNITWGGTGKTPLVGLILDFLKKQNKQCAVLMRGYGDDENTLLEKNHPSVNVISGSDRYHNALKFLENNPADIFVLDDGFQHWRLARDCDIVTINCFNSWAGNALIPRGALREPLKALGRAHMVVLTHCDLVSSDRLSAIKGVIERYVPKKDIFEARYVPHYFFRLRTPDVEIPVDEFQNKNAILFAGIGTPGTFRKTIEQLGIKVNEYLVYSDHHAYTQNDCLSIQNVYATHKADIIVTTEKDFMRSSKSVLAELDPYVLKIKMEITKNHDAFISRLVGFCIS